MKIIGLRLILCFVCFAGKISENDFQQPIPEKCIRKNFEIKGHDMINPEALSNLNLIECQTFCKQTIGCHLFTYKLGSDHPCSLKLASAFIAWNKVPDYPVLMAYSGLSDCGNNLIPNLKFLLKNVTII